MNLSAFGDILPSLANLEMSLENLKIISIIGLLGSNSYDFGELGDELQVLGD